MGDDIKPAFDTMDTDGDGSLSFDEFMIGLRGPLSSSRLKVVQAAFKKADRNGDGILNAEDLKRTYNVREHPKYKSGEWDAQQVYESFLNSLEPDPAKRDGHVTEEEFIKYYTGVSASVDKDSHFDLMM